MNSCETCGHEMEPLPGAPGYRYCLRCGTLLRPYLFTVPFLVDRVRRFREAELGLSQAALDYWRELGIDEATTKGKSNG